MDSKKKLKNILLGNALKSNDLEGEKLGPFWGVPIMASDAVSSVAYAIEEMLLVLVPIIGLAAVDYLGLVTSPIILLFLVLAFSYSQIIACYPNGGGAYVVSAENIGKTASLVAASALMIGYVMTVAVSLSAATAALVSAFPAFINYRLLFALLFLCIITLLNLRGMREASKLFGIPTYAFILIMLALIVTGFVKLFTGNLSPVQYPESMKSVTDGVGTVSLFLLLRAFSSGCSALTGVEVVSNAVPSFREPSQKNAKNVLFILVGIIIVIFGGSVILVTSLHIIPLEGKTVISQLGSAVFGHGIMFYILQFATSLILLLAANTAYNGLPTLLAILADDGYVPRQFMHRGTRLSFSNGILFIFFLAAFLLIIFNAETHYLIPLYAIGVFLSFTLSQTGMVLRWIRVKGKGYWYKMLINGLGALMTGTGTVIVFVTRFHQGSWLLAIVIPVIVYIMYRIEKHYQFVGRQLKVNNFMAHYHKSVSKDTNLCIVLVGGINRSVLKALNYANLITSNVVALHISTDEKQSELLRKKWVETGIDVPLEVVNSPYRELIEPVEDYISKREQNLEPGDMITIVMSRFMEESWFANILHNQTTYFIMQRLRRHRNVSTVLVPYLYSSAFVPACEKKIEHEEWKKDK
ncbi:amino acid permease [Lacrimispora xylanolytica]|uniref:APC family permease n=1 Tax=Lacrimispora xylanolytica TaxID=29375 RepID=A0ABY7A7N9_9FIRM|nr:APC family permease [Lacrimispora xylanolytica]WAJ22680.1 APC family permease [Lacrimispora xylanolytica]